jgi:Ni/Co efflux regulator RcnB
MRKFILSILLASAAASPALAQDHGRWHHDDSSSDATPTHEERQQAREQRQAAHDEVRQQRFDGGDAARVQPQVQPDRSARFEMWQNSGGGFEGRRFEQRDNVQANVAAPQAPEQQRSTWTGGRDGSRWTGNRDAQSGTWTGDRSTWTGNREARSGSWSGGNLRQGERPTPNVMRDPNPTTVNDSTRRQWQRAGDNRWASGTWNRDWRNDRRYDWRRYRDSHRSIFHIGIYYDPFGYGYQPFDIGYRLYPSYFGQQYWIDPGMYQLPYPPPGTVWVRYWDDALLVDTYSGEVIDVIRNFFW